MNELNKVRYKIDYKDKLKQRWDRLCEEVVGWVEGWNRFKEAMLE